MKNFIKNLFPFIKSIFSKIISIILFKKKLSPNLKTLKNITKQRSKSYGEITQFVDKMFENKNIFKIKPLDSKAKKACYIASFFETMINLKYTRYHISKERDSLIDLLNYIRLFYLHFVLNSHSKVDYEFKIEDKTFSLLEHFIEKKEDIHSIDKELNRLLKVL